MIHILNSEGVSICDDGDHHQDDIEHDNANIGREHHHSTRLAIAQAIDSSASFESGDRHLKWICNKCLAKYASEHLTD